ncbi:MAG: hypothetical protein ACK559_20245, partial [bacterium]
TGAAARGVHQRRLPFAQVAAGCIGVVGGHAARGRQGGIDHGVLGADEQVDRQQLLVDCVAGEVDVVVAQAQSAFHRRGRAEARPQRRCAGGHLVGGGAAERRPARAHRVER